MFESWFMWQVELMIEDDINACANAITNEILDYYLKKWMARMSLLSRINKVLNPY